MKKAIIFDMDGTIFQTNLILEEALEATFEKLRAQKLWKGATPIDTYRQIMGVPLQVVWQTLCPEHSEEVREQSNAWFHEQLVRLIRHKRGALYEGVEQTLSKLTVNHPIYIASNGQTPYLQAIFETYEMQQWVIKFYSIDEIESGNKSKLVQRVIDENQLETGFVIGDRLSDFVAAKDNGFQSIGVRFDFAQEDELEKADVVVNYFEDILAVVN